MHHVLVSIQFCFFFFFTTNQNVLSRMSTHCGDLITIGGRGEGEAAAAGTKKFARGKMSIISLRERERETRSACRLRDREIN